MLIDKLSCLFKKIYRKYRKLIFEERQDIKKINI